MSGAECRRRGCAQTGIPQPHRDDILNFLGMLAGSTSCKRARSMQSQCEKVAVWLIRGALQSKRGVSRRVQSAHTRSASTSHAHAHEWSAQHMSHDSCTCSRCSSWQGWAAQSFSFRLRARVLSSRPAPAVYSTGRWSDPAAAECVATASLGSVCSACAHAVYIWSVRVLYGGLRAWQHD